MRYIRMKKGASSKSKITCPLCKKSCGTYMVENISSKMAGNYDIYFCPNCRGEFSWPMRPMNYDSIFEPLDIDHDKFVNLLRESLRRSFYYSCMITFLDTIERGEILDIGAGLGIFLTHAYNLGFDTYGVDISKQSVEFLKANLPFAKVAVTGDVIHLPSHWPNNYKVISALDVFEHTVTPFDLGKRAYDLLAPGGYLLMSVPNRGRYYYRLGRIIDDFIIRDIDEPPYHLTRWRKETVQNFLEQIGFRKYSLAIGGLLWRRNITIKGNYSGLLSSMPRSLYRLSPTIPLPLIQVAEALGTHFIVFAQKDGGTDDLPLESIKKEVLTRVYKRQIPFFNECDVV
jgi:2-polyprenyl-3-methyl-5-hydroxy-6-metoxy-1,4-benzoquinol methylase